MKLFYDLLLGALLLLAGSPLAAQTLSVDLTDASGFTGQAACMDLIGENFDNIAGMQFALSYDTTELRYLSGSGHPGRGQRPIRRACPLPRYHPRRLEPLCRNRLYQRPGAI